MGQTIMTELKDLFTLYPVTRQNPLSQIIDEIDVVIDFTCANASFQHAIEAIKHKKPIIIGTTGLTKAMLDVLEEQANQKGVGCLYAPNFAYGAIWMNAMIGSLAKAYKTIDIKEIHHISKLDTPSGTALRLKEEMLAANPNSNIHISSERQYTKQVVHRITFQKDGESLSLQHIVNNRKAYLHALETAINRIVTTDGWIPYTIDFFQPQST